MPVLGSALPCVRASYPDHHNMEPAQESPATQRAVVALHGFQAELAQLRAAGLPTMFAQGLHRTSTEQSPICSGDSRRKLIGASCKTPTWFWALLVHVLELSPTQRLQLHLPLATELGGCDVQSAR